MASASSGVIVRSEAGPWTLLGGVIADSFDAADACILVHSGSQLESAPDPGQILKGPGDRDTIDHVGTYRGPRPAWPGYLRAAADRRPLWLVRSVSRGGL